MDEEKFKKFLEYRNNSKKRQIERQKQNKLEGKNKVYKIKKFSDKKIKMHEKDLIFYQEIWNERPHYCQNCNKFLGSSFYTQDNKPILYRYSHIIPKSIYPYLRHYKDNINLLCLECHTKFDNSEKEVMRNMKCYNEEKINFLKDLNKNLKDNNDNSYI